MSSWKCEIKRITDIQPIPEADKIETIFLDGWTVVARKGDYSIGQLVSYFPADSIIPIELLRSMGLENRLSGSLKNRVKPIRLRGQLSIGLIHKAPEGLVEGDAVDAHFGITKYEPPIPVELAGQCVTRPRTFSKYDIDNINDRLRDFIKDEPVISTCKIHGSFFGCVKQEGEIKVMSRNYALAESETNSYWMGARNSGILNAISSLPEGTWIMGELVPTQKFKYGQNKPTVFVFDIKGADGEFWRRKDAIRWCQENDIPFSPVLYEGPFDIDIIRGVAGGMEPISGNKIHINEGVVVAPLIERKNHRGERVIAKVVNPIYLTGDWDDEKVGG